MEEKTTYKRYLLGIFDDEKKVLSATKELVERRIPLHDVFTPYAVHGLDEAMGIRRSRLPIVTFLAGLLGFTLALCFQKWVFTQDWPMNIGGKPHFALPAFIPVAFEITVLVGGLTTVLFFFIRSKLYPGACANLLDKGITDGNFVIAIEAKDQSLDLTALKKYFHEKGAAQVCEKEVVL